MSFGQLVVGPPGAGKTTYCNGISQFLEGIGRKTAIINLDPANDHLPYPCSVDIKDLVSLQEVMEKMELGPNGGLVYCMEYLEANIDWLEEALLKLPGTYLLFDLPGQVELYTHHGVLPRLCTRLQKQFHIQLVCVHLVDSFHTSDSARFVSAMLLSLSAMLLMGLPHVNVLSKVDLLGRYGAPPLPLEYYTDLPKVEPLLRALNQEQGVGRYKALNKRLATLVQDFSLVGFHPLCITDKDSVAALMSVIDKTGGYVFGACMEDNEAVLNAAAGETGWAHDRAAAVQDKYLPTDEEKLLRDLRSAADEGMRQRQGHGRPPHCPPAPQPTTTTPTSAQGARADAAPPPARPSPATLPPEAQVLPVPRGRAICVLDAKPPPGGGETPIPAPKSFLDLE
ncbi:putative GPN-loop GTPase 2 [Paratrimastix pyriformis]|uniref:GPN-loop GTPase 2 n=1 Tax=Paratrimastix pyriformis TaxID=342808 RepID=A0ABQ8UQ39_9EUKA|nr:putative GPN-loop GTPase 2 [Paratrimastix pyriformis]